MAEIVSPGTQMSEKGSSFESHSHMSHSIEPVIIIRAEESNQKADDLRRCGPGCFL